MPNDTCTILVSENFKKILDSAKYDLTYTQYIEKLLENVSE